jgi:acetyl-CoA carboxylase biotin carboxyl carrier protein
MELQKITELIDLMSRSDLTELNLQEGEHSLRLVRGVPTMAAGDHGTTVSGRACTHSQEFVEAESSADRNQAEPHIPVPATSTRQVFKSPMVGTFFRAGAPGDKPFIAVGQQVKTGQILGVIEAMKMLTELECDVDGRIAGILVENGTFVEFGQPLFSIE